MQKDELDNCLAPVLVVCGPTASGKTALAMEIALSDIASGGAEIVSADSMQIYRGFDIGTAKASIEEQSLVQHHMIDICEPEEYFSVAQYKSIATNCIRAIQSRNKLAIICGGTGQYLSALIEGIDYIDMPVDMKIRSDLNTRADDIGNKNLLVELSALDPETAARLSISDRKRIVRALEVYYTTGLTQTEINRQSRLSGPDFKFLPVCLNYDRLKLYDKINARVLQMFDHGWIDEVKSLSEKGVPPDCTSMQAIGYRQIMSYLNKQIRLEDAISEIQQATRRYAKRQMTWFRSMKYLNWLEQNEISDNDDHSNQRLSIIRNLIIKY